MGSKNAGTEKAGPALIFSNSGYPLGLAHGRLFGSPPAASKAIAGAVEGCSATGAVGETGAPYSTVACILDELQAPDSVISRTDATRSLDGTLDSHWYGLTASWSCHRDNGLRVIVESARN